MSVTTTLLRRALMTGALVGTAALTLSACGPDDSSGGSALAPANTAAATATRASKAPIPGISGVPKTRSSAASGGSNALPDGVSPCPIPSNDTSYTAVVIDVATATRGVSAHTTQYGCGSSSSDDGYYPTDTVKSYPLATDVKMYVLAGADRKSTEVDLATGLRHINNCATHKTPTAPYICVDAGTFYYLTLNSAGEVNYLEQF